MSIQEFGVDLQTSGVIALWVVVLLRIPAARESRQQRSLLIAVAGLAASITIYLGFVSTALQKYVLDGPYAALFMNVWGVASSAFVLDFILAAMTIRRVRLVYGALTLIVGAMLYLYLSGKAHLGALNLTSAPPDSLYWWLIITAHLAAKIPCAIVCGIYAWRGRRDGPLATGLTLFAAAFTMSAVFWLCVLTFLLFRPATLPGYFPVMVGTTSWIITLGTAVPLVLTAAVLLHDKITLWRLWPLWRRLVQAVPHVALSGPAPRAADLWGLTRVTRFKLYRRVIEIRDAILSLRNYAPPDAEVLARRRLGESATAAHITALWLDAARVAKLQGEPRLPVGLQPSSDYRGDDIAAERSFLLSLARAYPKETV